MFVGTVSFVKDNSSIISDLGGAISVLPVWLLVAAGVYVCTQIIHLVIYRDLRRVVLVNVLMVLFLTIVTLILDREIAKTIQQSHIFNDDSFVGARLIEYIILTVILSIGALYTVIFICVHHDVIPKKKDRKKQKIINNNPLFRSDKIILYLSGGMLAMVIMFLAFTSSGARIIVNIVDHEQSNVLGRERYMLPIKEGEIIRIGDYIITAEEWNEDGVLVKTDQKIKRATEDTLLWDTRYKIENSDESGVKRFDCSVMFTK